MSNTKKILLTFFIPFAFTILLPSIGMFVERYIERYKTRAKISFGSGKSDIEIFFDWLWILSVVITFFLPCFIYWKDKKVKRTELDLSEN
jgi:hypothetical protein